MIVGDLFDVDFTREKCESRRVRSVRQADCEHVSMQSCTACLSNAGCHYCYGVGIAGSACHGESKACTGDHERDILSRSQCPASATNNGNTGTAPPSTHHFETFTSDLVGTPPQPTEQPVSAIVVLLIVVGACCMLAVLGLIVCVVTSRTTQDTTPRTIVQVDYAAPAAPQAQPVNVQTTTPV